MMHYQYSFEVEPASIDENGHVNNVEYVRWMQEAATAHAEAMGSLAALEDVNATWVVREHAIKYFRPAFLGDRIGVQTWVENFRKVRSVRRYRFLNLADHSVLAEGSTNWIFVNATTGKPMTVPLHIQDLFTLVPDSSVIPLDQW
jgi:acyl-CoA thioester hydrolase